MPLDVAEVLENCAGIETVCSYDRSKQCSVPCLGRNELQLRPWNADLGIRFLVEMVQHLIQIVHLLDLLVGSS